MIFTDQLETKTIAALTAEIIEALDKEQQNPSMYAQKADGTKILPFAELQLSYQDEGAYYYGELQRENPERYANSSELVRKYVPYAYRRTFSKKSEWEKVDRQRRVTTRTKFEGSVRGMVAKAKQLHKEGIVTDLYLGVKA